MDNPKKSIKDWPDDERPREKLIAKGAESLSLSELIAILINTGNKENSALALAQKLLAEADQSLEKLARFDIEDIKKVKGIGSAKAVTIAACLEIGRRRQLLSVNEVKIISSFKDAVDIFLPLLKDKSVEEFWIMLLNRQNKVLKTFPISKGGTTSTVVDIKIILKSAIDHKSNSIIVSHNHPSGNNNPSNEDKIITNKLKEGAALLDITLLDHIIIAGDSFF